MSSHQSRNLTRSLVTLTLVLTILGVIYQCLKHLYDGAAFLILLSPFNLNEERNIPTLYSTTLLLLAAVLLMRIAVLKQRDRYHHHWMGLSILFFYLSVDEATSIHEEMEQARDFLSLGTGNFLYKDAWVVIGIVFVAMIGLLYSRFIWALPKPTRIQFLLAAAIYILGALGMEIVGGYWRFSHGSAVIYDVVLITLEELLEMLGIVLFIYTLSQVLDSSRK